MKIIRNFISRKPSRAIKASSVVLLSYSTSQIIRLAGNLILTRLLAPEIFGLMAFVNVLLTAVNMLSDLGIKQYIIRNDNGSSPSVLNTAWVIQIWRGSCIGVFTLFIAAICYSLQTRSFFDTNTVLGNSITPLILCVMALQPFITGFSSTRQFTLFRNLQLTRIELIGLSCQLISMPLTILLALVFSNVWGLVAGSIMSCVMNAIATHVFIPGEPHKFKLDKNEGKEIVNFTKWIFLSSIAGFIVNNSDKLWFSFIMTTSQLGVYSIAASLAGILLTILSKISISVFLPILSEVDRKSPDKLKASYYRIRKYVDPFVMLFSGIIFSLAPAVINILYDSRYSDAGFMLQILILNSISVTFFTGERYLVARQLTRERFFVTLSHAIILNILIYLLYNLEGINGALYAIVLGPVIPIFLLFYFLKKNRMLSLLHEFRFVPLIFLGIYTGSLINKVF